MSAPSDEDAVYPTALTDADGQPFDSSQRFLLHFGPGQTQTSGRFVMSKATTCGNAIEPCAEPC